LMEEVEGEMQELSPASSLTAVRTWML